LGGIFSSKVLKFDRVKDVSECPILLLTDLNYAFYAISSACPIIRRSLMKKIMMIAMLFVQVFLTSENTQATEIQSTETGKGNLCPAANDTE
jgi:hypothetical protein